MSIFWNIFFWLALVAVVAITAWTVVRVVTKNAEARKYVADAQYGGGQVLERLGTIDERLAAIEKTLTDIP